MRRENFVVVRAGENFVHGPGWISPFATHFQCHARRGSSLSQSRSSTFCHFRISSLSLSFQTGYTCGQTGRRHVCQLRPQFPRMGVKKKQRPRQNLAAGRPPTVKRPKSITRKATKSLIGKIHVLEKRRVQAAAKGDAAEEARIAAEIESLGGLEKYQEASLQGQREDRGGDSSRVLLDWFAASGISPSILGNHARLRMLEVGALSTDNACSKSGLFDIERIDLNSQGEGILQQDFMLRPLPRDDSQKFDVISLSLVLNFVPEPRKRGQMLRRTLEFLHASRGYSNSSLNSLFPSLFLVLPAPCVTNSRYLDEERLGAIMSSLGYTKVKSKITQRLVYYLWKRDAANPVGHEEFAKKELRPGGSRNNFAIVLKQGG